MGRANDGALWSTGQLQYPTMTYRRHIHIYHNYNVATPDWMGRANDGALWSAGQLQYPTMTYRQDI